MDSRLRIALLAPLMVSVPPQAYAGTERVIATLASCLHERGHNVTLFASGDSQVDCELVPVIPRAAWKDGFVGDPSPLMELVMATAWRQHRRFDLIHSHLETDAFLFARHCPTPVVSTLHGRLDEPGIPLLLREFRDIPLVAISDSQGRWAPDANWMATIHHGLPLAEMVHSTSAGDYLVVVGRATPEKGIAEAIEFARRTKLPLKVAAKVNNPAEQAFFDEVIAPAIEEGTVEFLGEIGESERDPLLAGARATLMLGAWPEPFGLVAIESMATGTPVIARRAGALPEIVDHLRTGFLIDDLREADLALDLAARVDRAEVRRRTIERFSPERMTDEYEKVYRRVLEGAARGR
ncbi:MAG: glycosyltransferase family 4 protein [Chloroflexota bacterium]|nr:glycosyltransferase family 4 protein [Chloroflexota bacterium]